MSTKLTTGPNRIREHRRRLGLKLADISSATGWSRAEVSRLELGIRPLRADHLIQLSTVFKVKPDEITWADEAEKLLGPLAAQAGAADRLEIRGRPFGGSIVDFDKPSGQCEILLPNGLSRGGIVVYNPRTDLELIPQGALLVLTTLVPPRPGDLIVKVREKDNTAEVETFDGHRARGYGLYRVAAVLPQ